MLMFKDTRFCMGTLFRFLVIHTAKMEGLAHLEYSSVPNRRAGPNKRARGKNSSKTLNVQVRIDVQGELFLENQ